MQLRDTLEDTGHWGTARVVPATVNSFDLTVDGKILESNGAYLKLEVTARDATGKVWIEEKEYEGRADTRVYRDNYTAGRDPFENVYVAIANDLLAARNLMTGADLANIRRVSELRFAADFAPVAFSEYLAKDKKTGEYKVLRLPAEDDVLVQAHRADPRARLRHDRHGQRALHGRSASASRSRTRAGAAIPMTRSSPRRS